MWNKYPFSASHALVLVWFVAALIAASCLSNPTPHPAQDAAGAFSRGADANRAAEPGTPGDPGPDFDENAGLQDMLGAPLDGGAAGDSLDGVGPEDGGGSTEPPG